MQKTTLAVWMVALALSCAPSATPVSAQSVAARVEAVTIPSSAMQRELKANVVLPAAYNAEPDRRFPVVYLLHGWSGNQDDWLTKVPELPSLADRHGLIIVTPDGDYDSWYLDSPGQPQRKFATYIGQEVPAWVDANYRTIPRREARAITGLSMGGHGALSLAFANTDLYGAAGSTSGGMDLLPFSNHPSLSPHLGDPVKNRDRWIRHSVVNQLYLLKGSPRPALYIDCGTGDFFYEVNLKMHNTLLKSGIPHEFVIRPGAHDWDYWRNSIRYQLLFFSDYFANGTPQ